MRCAPADVDYVHLGRPLEPRAHERGTGKPDAIEGLRGILDAWIEAAREVERESSMAKLIAVEEVATGKRHDLPGDAVTGTTPLVSPSHREGRSFRSAAGAATRCSTSMPRSGTSCT
jgi:hypothetical protein